MEKVVDNPEKDLTMTMETEGFLEMATLARCFLVSTSHAGPSDPMPRAPSIGKIFQSTMKYLRNLLPPIERLFLNEQMGEKQSVDALRSLVHMGQYLTSLASSNLNVPTIEKEEINLLKYRLEHLERDNTELAKELSFTEEAL